MSAAAPLGGGRRRVSRAPAADVLEPAAVAAWLGTDLHGVARAIVIEGLPVLGYRTDGVPLMATCELRAWLRGERVRR